MKETQYKYNLNHLYSLLPRTIGLSDLVTQLAKYGISESTFYRDRNITLESDTDIRAERLSIYAKVFDCTLEDLFNKHVDAESIHVAMSRVKIKSGLS